ncbi:hypothetical protein [Pseudomonas alabamensis]|uniref:hypothetical protein n=1 Tax=Pseudomonas alabamensis TaxID=3064349 RepID=UPI003F6492D5
MNLNDQLTLDQLARLFATRKDSHDDHVLWISQAGDVRLDRLPPNIGEGEIDAHMPSMKACLKVFRRGQGYVGRKAAADTDFVSGVLESLKALAPEGADRHLAR